MSESKKEEKSKKKRAHRFKSTSIEHHEDGSHTVRHIPLASDSPADAAQPPEKSSEVSYAAPDHEALQAKLAENLGMGGEQSGPASPSSQPVEAALRRLS